MIILRLSASLSSLLPAQEHDKGARRTAIDVDATNWSETANEILRRFERLAAHMFEVTGRLRPGVLVAVNDVVTAPGRVPHVSQGDEVYLFQQMAGG
jgi:hypothetical protein